MLTIIKYTLLENIRSRVYGAALGIILLILLIAWLGAGVNYNSGNLSLTILAFGMSLTELLIIALCLFLPVSVLYLEYERGTAPVFWAKLPSRSHYFWAKWVAFWVLVLSIAVIATLFIAIFAGIHGASPDQLMRLGYFLIGLTLETAGLLSLVFLLYTAFRTTLLASFVGLLLVYLSVFLEAGKDMAQHAPDRFSALFYNSLYYLLPQFRFFNFEQTVVHGQPVAMLSLGLSCGYAVLLVSVFLGLTHIIIEKREW
ncbi:ABC transporter permease [Candidatus Margulisiibacteriota bacterium]